jgi:serine protease Do
MNATNLIGTVALGCLGGFGGFFIANHYLTEPPKAFIVEKENGSKSNARQVNLDGTIPMVPADFTVAAESSIHSVVHIGSTFKSQQPLTNDPIYNYFFRGAPQEQKATGSGVIISEDGYIVTNNHVIADASKIEVTLNNKKTYSAKLVGTDPGTDIAVLKIEETDLPAIILGNSEEVKIGEWVLAVGNPFNLTSTVTAGIVSAKSRNINILQGNATDKVFPIESFIQTDAAVNPGNSGGALVNTQGELIGINTAIASNTGSYSGYSFAVPVNLVKKVTADLMQFGTVQRAFLGVNIREMDQALANELNIDQTNGVYVAGVVEGGAADEADIKTGDIIVGIEGIDINTSPELLENIGQYRPGETVNIRLIRDGSEILIPVELKNSEGTTASVKKTTVELKSALGATFREATAEECSKLKIKSGVKVTSITIGKLYQSGIKKGLIITKIDNESISSVDKLMELLEEKEGGVLIEGIYPNGTKAYFGFGL